MIDYYISKGIEASDIFGAKHDSKENFHVLNGTELFYMCSME